MPAASPSGRRWVLAALMVLAAAVRLPPAMRNGLWTDEGYTRALAERGFTDMVGLFSTESNGALYQVLVWPLARAGDAEALLRLPSVLAGIVGVLLVHRAGRALASPNAALTAAAFFAVHPMAVVHGSEARPYELVAVFSAMAVWCVAGEPGMSGRRRAAGAVLAVAGLAYANSLSALLMAGPLLWIALARGVPRRALLSCAAAVAVLATPLAAWSIASASGRDPLYWIPSLSLGGLAGAGWSVAGGAGGVALVLVCGIALALQRRSAGPAAAPLRPGSPVVILAVWLLLPPVLLAAASLWKPLFVTRYLICVLPAACIAGAALVHAVSGTRLRRVMTVAAGLLLAVQSLAMWGPSEDARGAMRDIAARTRAGDPVLIDSAVALPVSGAYLPRLRGSAGMLAVSEWGDQGLPPRVALLQNPGGYSEVPDGPPSPALMGRLLAPTGRLAVVVSHADGQHVWSSAGIRWALARCRAWRRDRPGFAVAVIDHCGDGLRKGGVN